MTRRTAIVGVGLADVGQGPASPYDLIASAAQRALNEAGLSPHQVDGLASTGLGMMPPVEVAEYLGLRPRWMDSLLHAPPRNQICAKACGRPISTGGRVERCNGRCHTGTR